MIPADHWHDNGDGTAWWVLNSTLIHGVRPIATLDRPCDTCGGFRSVQSDIEGVGMGVICPDCIGTGRHTFDIGVQKPCPNPLSRDGRCQWCADRPDDHGHHTYRVSVVPGMVLPIHNRSFDREDWTERQITLPPVAAPGMWAVLLAVHT